MKSFLIILILLWIVMSALVILFVVVLSSRLGKQELDMTYREEFEEVETEEVVESDKFTCASITN